MIGISVPIANAKLALGGTVNAIGLAFVARTYEYASVRASVYVVPDWALIVLA